MREKSSIPCVRSPSSVVFVLNSCNNLCTSPLSLIDILPSSVVFS